MILYTTHICLVTARVSYTPLAVHVASGVEMSLRSVSVASWLTTE